ncbi:MAG: hypothetical protein F6K39_45800 [Okeania sp. SIO3B3]|nr:hypothetical protein [Okeania sp. SIO3B3]
MDETQLRIYWGLVGAVLGPLGLLIGYVWWQGRATRMYFQAAAHHLKLTYHWSQRLLGRAYLAGMHQGYSVRLVQLGHDSFYIRVYANQPLQVQLWLWTPLFGTGSFSGHSMPTSLLDDVMTQFPALFAALDASPIAQVDTTAECVVCTLHPQARFYGADIEQVAHLLALATQLTQVLETVDSGSKSD